MVKRKHQRGLEYEVGDEISFYRDKQVRRGVVCFVGEDTISVYPCAADRLGTEGAPMRSVEHTIKRGDII
jgi:hypothetical protein